MTRHEDVKAVSRDTEEVLRGETDGDGRVVRPSDPRAPSERRRAPPRIGVRATSSSSTTRRVTATPSSSRWLTTPPRSEWTRCRWVGSEGEQMLGLQGRRLRRRPAHDHGSRRSCRGRAADARRCGSGPNQRIGGHRPGPDVPGPHPALRAAPGHHAGRPTTWCGTSATSSSPAPTRAPTRSTARAMRSTAGSASATTRGASGTTDAARCGCGCRSSSTTGSSASGTGSYPNGASVYTDGCWAGTDGSEPVPVVDFRHDACLDRSRRQPAPYGEHGDDIAGLSGTCHVHARRRASHRGRGRGHLRPPLRAVPSRGGST